MYSCVLCAERPQRDDGASETQEARKRSSGKLPPQYSLYKSAGLDRVDPRLRGQKWTIAITLVCCSLIY